MEISPNGVRDVIIAEALKLLPLVYHSFRNLLEGLNEDQVILLWFLESHKDGYYPRPKLYRELEFVTEKERKKISGLITNLRKKKRYIEVRRNRGAKDKITPKGSECLSRILNNVKIFSKTLGIEILSSIEKEQDRENLIDLSTKFVERIQRDPDFLSSAIIRAREQIKNKI